MELGYVKCVGYSDSAPKRGLKEEAAWISFKEDGEDGGIK
jgi:hypothetical protein